MEIFTVPTVFPYLPANDELYRFFIFQVFSKIQPRHFYNYNFPPRHQIIIIIFRRATTTMAAGRQKDEFYLYIGRLRHGPNPAAVPYRARPQGGHGGPMYGCLLNLDFGEAVQLMSRIRLFGGPRPLLLL